MFLRHGLFFSIHFWLGRWKGENVFHLFILEWEGIWAEIWRFWGIWGFQLQTGIQSISWCSGLKTKNCFRSSKVFFNIAYSETKVFSSLSTQQILFWSMTFFKYGEMLVAHWESLAGRQRKLLEMRTFWSHWGPVTGILEILSRKETVTCCEQILKAALSARHFISKLLPKGWWVWEL